MIVGTGTGGGIVVDGRVLTGPNAIAGEWGHNPLPWPTDDERPGPACYCGKSGCIETFLSGPGLARDYRDGDRRRSSTRAEIARARRERRRRAPRRPSRATRTAWRGRSRRCINVLDPDVIVLGGGMSNLARLYESVPRLWQAWAFSDRVATRLRPPCTATRAACAARPGSGAATSRRRAGRYNPAWPTAPSTPSGSSARSSAWYSAWSSASPAPASAGVVRELLGIARHTAETAIWISRPLIPLRVAIGFLGILMLVGLLVSLRSLQVQMGPPTLPELAQGIESAIGDVVYVAVAVFFLTTIETRIKRRRALRAIHELRSIAHVIDMHQLTKDPEWVLARGPETGLVPPRSMSPLRAVALPRLLLGGALAHRKGRGALRPALRGLRSTRRGERGRAADDGPLAQDLAEADGSLRHAGGRGRRNGDGVRQRADGPGGHARRAGDARLALGRRRARCRLRMFP